MARKTLRVMLVALLVVPLRAEALELDQLRIRLEHIGESAGQLYLGEPLELEVTTVNEGPDRVRGYFKAFASSPAVKFYLHRMNGGVSQLNTPRDESGFLGSGCIQRTTSILGPQQSVTHLVRFLLDPRSNAAWLGDEGEYEVFVVIRPFDGVSAEEVRTEPLRIAVQRPPESLRAAFEEYRSARLDELVSDPEARLGNDPGATLTAEAFLKEFPETTYGRHVRNALLRGLRMRAANGLASRLENEAYGRLTKEKTMEELTGSERR